MGVMGAEEGGTTVRVQRGADPKSNMENRAQGQKSAEASLLALSQLWSR